jgi:hypothetical protein
LKNKVILADANWAGAAFYTFDFGTEEGKMIPLDVKGRVLQEINYDEKSNRIHSVWSAKKIACSNTKKENMSNILF